MDLHGPSSIDVLQVNTYPGPRNFKAIGVGGEEFVQAMRAAVESVLGSPLHEQCIQQRPSAKGSYVSVTLGPVVVQNTDQVRQMHPSLRLYDVRTDLATLSCLLLGEAQRGVLLQVVDIYAAMRRDERLKWYM